MTNDERVRRHVTDDPSCSICEAACEDIDHIAMNLQDGLKFAKNPNNWSLLFSVVIWNIWRAQNAKVFETPLDGDGAIIERSSRLIQVTLQPQVGVSPSAKNNAIICRGPDSWTVPPAPWIKINADAACSGTDNYARCGGVAQDSLGNWIFGFLKFIDVC
ncbi:uncharacterized protein LOC120128655 [Hibiscus syriacus]|uniref:uncharacterized protein LOC120128655 n=1 Tax=Hibiscus syriacus TaxID=106335 RepID=UPI0019227340|nr:uncharacterized protein LOC120128655 [Hibiscus syriacus]